MKHTRKQLFGIWAATGGLAVGMALVAFPMALRGSLEGRSTEAAIAVIRDAVGRVESARIADDLRRLTSFPSRHSRSEGCDQAARLLQDRFREAGFDDVTFQEFSLAGKTCRNVVCTKPGTARPEQVIVIGAHYDSRSRDIGDPDAPAPGADDNGSGTVGLLELARVLKGVETTQTIRFVAFSGEEQGLVGSTAFAKQARADGMPISLMINMDMIGHPMDQAAQEVYVESDNGNRSRGNDEGSRKVAETMTRAAATFTKLKTKSGPIYGTDYMPFEAQGYVVVGVFDGADKAPFYHSDSDALDVVDTQYTSEVVRLVLATVLEIAGKP